MASYKPGVYDISNSDYHASNGVSRSALWTYKKSPYHYWYEYLSGEKKEDKTTPSMMLGEMVHTLSLEGVEEYNKRYVVAPDVNKRTKAGKEQLAAFTYENQGKLIVEPDMHLQCVEMAKTLAGNDVFPLVKDGKVEKSIYFEHKKTGMMAKVRPDNWHMNVVVDLKTTADASYRGFQSSAFKFGYFLQAGMIKVALRSIGIDLSKFIFICVENKAPFATATYFLDEEALTYGVDQFNFLMARLKDSLDKDEWNSYETQTLMLPAYAMYEE